MTEQESISFSMMYWVEETKQAKANAVTAKYKTESRYYTSAESVPWEDLRQLRAKEAPVATGLRFELPIHYEVLDLIFACVSCERQRFVFKTQQKKVADPTFYLRQLFGLRCSCGELFLGDRMAGVCNTLALEDEDLLVRYLLDSLYPKKERLRGDPARV